MTLKHCANVVPLGELVGRRGSAMAATSEWPMLAGATQFVPDSQRPLAVIMSWLAAQEKHIEKYRSLWLQRGFDVLTVKMTPYQFLLPKIGSHVLVKDLIKFLYAISPHYPEFVLHCFSVGAYEFGEMLTHLKDDEFMETIAKFDNGRDPRRTIESSIKGIIFDSAVNLEGIPSGVSRSISSNETVAKAIESSIRGHLKLAYPVATKYYQVASKNVHENHLHAPALVIVSDKDKIGARHMNEELVKGWRKNGIDVSMQVFKDSAHVQHMNKYPAEYSSAVDVFLKKVNLDSLK